MSCHTPKYVLFCFWECVWLEYVPSISIPLLGTINILLDMVSRPNIGSHGYVFHCTTNLTISHPSISSKATRGNLHKPSSSAISFKDGGCYSHYLSQEKKPSYFPLYWLFFGDLYNGLLWFIIIHKNNWVGAFFHCSPEQQTNCSTSLWKYLPGSSNKWHTVIVGLFPTKSVSRKAGVEPALPLTCYERWSVSSWSRCW